MNFLVAELFTWMSWYDHKSNATSTLAKLLWRSISWNESATDPTVRKQAQYGASNRSNHLQSAIKFNRTNSWSNTCIISCISRREKSQPIGAFPESNEKIEQLFFFWNSCSIYRSRGKHSLDCNDVFCGCNVFCLHNQQIRQFSAHQVVSWLLEASVYIILTHIHQSVEGMDCRQVCLFTIIIVIFFKLLVEKLWLDRTCI